MVKQKKLTRVQERIFSAHHILIDAAESATKDAETKKKARQPGWRHRVLTAMTLSALAIEALCNSVGERFFEDWEDFESARPIAKLRIIASKLEIAYEKNDDPWAAAIWLMKFRNSIVHAKPEFIEKKESLTRTEFDRSWFSRPQSKIEKNLTIGNAQRAVRTVERIKEILCEKIPAEKAFGLYADMSGGSTSI
jgi:hypothetical protein